MDETLRLHHSRLRLQQKIQGILVVRGLFLKLFLSVKLSHEYVLGVVLGVVADSLALPPKRGDLLGLLVRHWRTVINLLALRVIYGSDE